MSDRLPSHLLVAALIRRVTSAGGAATVVAKGDRDAGDLLILPLDHGLPGRALERAIGPAGTREWLAVGPEPSDPPAFAAWLERRRRIDPDLWIVELDSADAERFAAETIPCA